jgi:hypothetical protein
MLGFVCATRIALNAGAPLLPAAQQVNLDNVIQDHGPLSSRKGRGIKQANTL